jgi:hypothetical protein
MVAGFTRLSGAVDRPRELVRPIPRPGSRAGGRPARMCPQPFDGGLQLRVLWCADDLRIDLGRPRSRSCSGSLSPAPASTRKRHIACTNRSETEKKDHEGASRIMRVGVSRARRFPVSGFRSRSVTEGGGADRPRPPPPSHTAPRRSDHRRRKGPLRRPLSDEPASARPFLPERPLNGSQSRSARDGSPPAPAIGGASGRPLTSHQSASR